MPSLTVDERRCQRSRYTSQALRYWLAAVARRQAVASLVLADEAGLLIAASSDGPEADEVAATAPLRAPPSGGPQAVQTVTVHQTPLLLCVRGPLARQRAALDEARAGIDRILAGV